MQVGRNATGVRARLKITDAANTPVTGIAFNDPLLELETLAHTATGFAPKTLVAGTLGVYLANSWVEVDDGWYEYGVPDGLRTQDGQLKIRAKYSTAPWASGDVEYTSFDDADMVALRIAIANGPDQIGS